VGERATGLGGAFTAIANDASGTYYNPAGIAEAPYSSVSLSSAVYGFVGNRGSVDTGGLNVAVNDLDTRSFISYPTTAAWIQQVRKGAGDGSGRIQLAFSIITPQSSVGRDRLVLGGPWEASDTAGELNRADLLIALATEDETLWFGLSAGWKIHRRVAVGATLYASRRTGLYQLHQHGLVYTADAATQQETGRAGLASRVDTTFSHYGLLGVVGAVFHATDHMRIGAAFRTPSLELHGSADINTLAAYHDQTTSKSTFEAKNYEGVTFRDRQPLKATLGVAYLVPRMFGVSVDFSLHGPVGEYAIFEDDSEPALASDYRMKKRLLWQVNAGLEYYVKGVIPLRAGFFTNRSSLAEFDACLSTGECGRHENLLTDPLDLYGVAGSVGYEVDKATLTLGLSYNYGSRQSETSGLALDVSRSFLFVVLGGSFRF
jgi:long-chain fatty acid transport protein